MALFKEINCVHCGKKAGMMSRTKLMYDDYVCGKCTSGIPAEVIANLHECDEDFANIRNFFDVENKQREKLFKETKKFKSLHLDEVNQLLYMDHIRPKMYIHMDDVEDFDLRYIPDTVKEGFLSDKVTGDIHLNFKMTLPPFARNEIIAKDVKSTGEIKGLIKKKLDYNNPKGMDEFVMAFELALAQSINRRLNSILHRDDEEE